MAMHLFEDLLETGKGRIAASHYFVYFIFSEISILMIRLCSDIQLFDYNELAHGSVHQEHLLLRAVETKR
jgi:hypothetical protein